MDFTPDKNKSTELLKAWEKGLKETQKNPLNNPLSHKNILSSSNVSIGDLKYSGKPLDSRYKHSGMTGGRKRGLSRVDCTLFPDKIIPSPLRGEGEDGGDSLFSTFSSHYKSLTSLPRKIRRAMQKKWKHSLAGIALVLALGGAPAFGNTIMVADGEVAIAENDICSIREAIENADATTTPAPHDDCTAGDENGADTIMLPDGSVFELQDGPFAFNGSNGLPVITTPITIEGNGSEITRNSSDPFRIFAIDGEGGDNGDLTLRDITVSGGFAAGSGGGILNRSGILTLDNSIVSENAAGIDGGAVFNSYGILTLENSTISGNTAGINGGGIIEFEGTTTVNNSTISGNAAENRGGGIYNPLGTVNITNSTILGNMADNGGGIYNSDGTLTIESSTISENDATVSGGGIFNDSSSAVTINNSTISGNTAFDFGGGIYNNINSTVSITNSTISENDAFDGGGITNRGNANIKNTIVSGNSGDTEPNCIGTINDNGNNLSDGGCFTAISSATDFDVNTFLANLGDNGGPTFIHALLNPDPTNNPNPAIDAISGNCTDQSSNTISEDQRGFPRPSKTDCDIGAYEVQQEPFIKITKLTDPSTMDTNFSFDLNTDPATIFSLADGEMFSTVLSPGDFTLTETNAEGFIVEEVECTDESVDPTITIDNDSDPTTAILDFTLTGTERLECTVTNTNDFSVLNVITSGDGSGMVTGQGIDCPIECSEPFPNGDVVTLTAVAANSGSVFNGFTGTGCEGGSPINVTVVEGGVTCDAEFEPDDDNDGVGNSEDNCPVDANGPDAGPNNQLDSDSDGMGDVCDPDDDNDGVDDGEDDDPLNQQVCSDTDGDTCDDCTNTTDTVNQGGNTFDDGTDADGDEICSATDQCDNDANKTEPGECGCGVADTDTDNDGTPDCNDTCPDDAGNDVDEDDICGDGDNCPDTPNSDQADIDEDGAGDACDDDDDNDGVDDENDSDSSNPNECRDEDNDTCDDCAVTGADESGGDTDNDGPDADNDGICDDGESTGDDDDDSDEVEIGEEDTEDGTLTVGINAGSGVAGGSVLVDLPAGLLPLFADFDGVECDIPNESALANVTEAEADVICDVDDFPPQGELNIGLCTLGEQTGLSAAEIEVAADNSNEEFADFVNIVLNELEQCDDAEDSDGGGGCSIAPVDTNKTSALSNFLVMLVPAIVGFGAMFWRRRKV